VITPTLEDLRFFCRKAASFNGVCRPATPAGTAASCESVAEKRCCRHPPNGGRWGKAAQLLVDLTSPSGGECWHSGSDPVRSAAAALSPKLDTGVGVLVLGGVVHLIGWLNRCPQPRRLNGVLWRLDRVAQ
jgi:hypothetical protein